MRELEPLRRLAPPVEPLAPDAVARIRARALAGVAARLPAAGLLRAGTVVAAAVAVVVVLTADRTGTVPAQAPRPSRGGGRRRGSCSTRRLERHARRTSGRGRQRRDDVRPRRPRSSCCSWMPADVGRGHRDDKPGVRPQRAASTWTARGRRSGTRGPGDDYVARSGATAPRRCPRAVRRTTRAAFAAVVGGLERVDDAAWRRALPERAVTPDDQRQAVEKMVGEIPLPPGVDLARPRRRR